MSAVVIGLGNPFRRDDGVGWRVVASARPLLSAEVAVRELDGEPARIVEAWDGADLAVVVDAVVTGAAPGTVHVLDRSIEALPAGAARGGSHALGVGEAVALARAVGRAPGRLVVLGVEVADLGDGPGLSPAVERAVAGAAARVAAIVGTPAGAGTAGPGGAPCA
ncbi:MAG: hydrogenase maturation protease [Acidimicrobiia bacterium]|nr:hydrogenase maturation protease [Acidimicrobiia bacterium]